MAEARFELAIPEGVWIGELSRRHPGTTFRVLAALPKGSLGVGLTEIRSDSLTAVIEEMAAYEAVPELAVLSRAEGRALVQFETTLPLLLLAARDSGVPLEMPFELVDGELAWEVTASREHLSELAGNLDAFGVPYTVDYLREEVAYEQLLTDTQRDLVERAIEHGYYDTPRECSLTELAETVGRSKSTVSEMLHRAEEKIVKHHIDREQENERRTVGTPAN